MGAIKFLFLPNSTLSAGVLLPSVLIANILFYPFLGPALPVELGAAF